MESYSVTIFASRAKAGSTRYHDKVLDAMEVIRLIHGYEKLGCRSAAQTLRPCYPPSQRDRRTIWLTFLHQPMDVCVLGVGPLYICGFPDQSFCGIPW